MSSARVYRPTGNPIDEWFFVPLLQATDLVAEFLTPEEEATLLRWVRAFALSRDRFYEPRPAADTARSNNWMARRLLIRTVASTVARDQSARATIPALLSDFVQRDALLYHVADLQPLIEMML